MGIIKASETANITVIRNGLGSRFKEAAVEIAIGVINAAVALLDIVSVKIKVIR